jgi:hypothetical protein
VHLTFLFKPALYPRLVSLVVMLLTCSQLLNAQAPASGLLVSVAFKTNNPFGNSPPMSGTEAAATIANPAFGAANVWNNLQSPWAPPLTTNPSWTSLVDSTGTSTSVSLFVTGTVFPLDLTPFIPNPDPLRSAFLGWNSWTNGGGGAGPGESTSLVWKLTGLPPRAKFDICIYGGVADADRGFTMTVAGIIQYIPTFNSTSSSLQNCILFSNIPSNAKGIITIHADGVGDSKTAQNEANWAGFQLVQLAAPNSPRRLGLWRAPR